MTEAEESLAALMDALQRRYRGTTAAQFERGCSPAIANAFVRGWNALGLNPLDIPTEWQDMADSYADIG